jgi:hypothetical protein
MVKKDMKTALTSSLKAEDEAVRSRFEKAENLLDNKALEPANYSKDELQHEKQQPTVQKEKVIRDSFTLPSGDYELIAEIRQRCLNSALNATKSEVIRAGLHILMSLSDDDLVNAIENLEKIKTGRPAGKV